MDYYTLMLESAELEKVEDGNIQAFFGDLLAASYQYDVIIDNGVITLCEKS